MPSSDLNLKSEPHVLKESHDWLIINKPSGFHTVQGKDLENQNVEEWLRKNFQNLSDLPEAGLVHRLDQKTSGCLFVAKNLKIFSDFQKRFRTGTGIQKIYLALVEGKPTQKGFDLYFSSRYKSSKKMTVKTEGPAREKGQCAWKVLEFKNNRSLLEVELIGPGKRHQIRAGLSFLQHPIIGDELYGGPPWIKSFGLHAFRLVFDGITAESPMPETWKSPL
jgi:23S rRNA pseudouridine1911/1915/1917 synthase